MGKQSSNSGRVYGKFDRRIFTTDCARGKYHRQFPALSFFVDPPRVHYIRRCCIYRRSSRARTSHKTNCHYCAPMPRGLCASSVWPFFGLLSTLCSIRLSRVSQLLAERDATVVSSLSPRYIYVRLLLLFLRVSCIETDVRPALEAGF